MTVSHLYVRCTRCGARGFLYPIAPDRLQQEPTASLSPEPATVWMREHQAAVHEPDDPLRLEIDRWCMGYRSALPPAPYELVEETEEDA